MTALQRDVGNLIGNTLSKTEYATYSVKKNDKLVSTYFHGFIPII